MKQFLIALVILVVVGAGTFVAVRYARGVSQPVTSAPGAPTGGRATLRFIKDPGTIPRLVLKTIDGKTLDSNDFKGKVVLVNFWATWCDPCRDEQPELVELSDDYRDRGVEFLGVNERDDTAKARAWVKEFAVPYPSIVDEPGAWADDFAFFGLPDTYVIDRAGIIRWSVYGQTDAAQLKGLIDEVLALPK